MNVTVACKTQLYGLGTVERVLNDLDPLPFSQISNSLHDCFHQTAPIRSRFVFKVQHYTFPESVLSAHRATPLVHRQHRPLLVHFRTVAATPPQTTIRSARISIWISS